MVKRTLMTMLLFISITNISYAQEIKFSGSLVGFGIAKVEKFKKITTANYFDLTYEQVFKAPWSWRVGLGINRLQYEGITAEKIEYFRERTFLTLPAIFRYYYSSSRQSAVYLEFGIVNNYELKDRIDYNSFLRTDEKFSGGGYIMNFSTSTGFKTKLGSGYILDIGIGGQKNVFASYKKKENKIRPSASFLTFSFSKKLQRSKKTKK